MDSLGAGGADATRANHGYLASHRPIAAGDLQIFALTTESNDATLCRTPSSIEEVYFPMVESKNLYKQHQDLAIGLRDDIFKKILAREPSVFLVGAESRKNDSLRHALRTNLESCPRARKVNVFILKTCSTISSAGNWVVTTITSYFNWRISWRTA